MPIVCGIKGCTQTARDEQKVEMVIGMCPEHPEDELHIELYLCDTHWEKVELPESCLLTAEEALQEARPSPYKLR